MPVAAHARRRPAAKRGATGTATEISAAHAIVAAHDTAFGAAHRQAFADFEAVVRPSSEVYWLSHNRATAEFHARRGIAPRGPGPARRDRRSGLKVDRKIVGNDRPVSPGDVIVTRRGSNLPPERAATGRSLALPLRLW